MRFEQVSQDLRAPLSLINIRKQRIGDNFPLGVSLGTSAHPVLAVTPLR
jgi:hypothetical protein